MNRKLRRASQSHSRKLARDASPEEIFPAGHAPVQSHLTDVMKGVIDVLRKSLGSNFDITLFVAERLPSDGSDRLPRFNYMSTAQRADMIAVLEAFIQKQRDVGPTIDKIADEPPTGTSQ